MTEEQLKQIEALGPYAVPLATGIVMATLVFGIGWMASKWANRLAVSAGKRAKLDEAITRFAGSMVQYTVLAATVIAALGQLGVETTSLVAVFASAGLAIGLALQGTLSNFASGVMILFFRPIQLGDVVTVGGQTGKVMDIGLFATTLHTPENIKIVQSNSSVMGGTILNLTTLGTRRASIDIGVAYGSDLEQVMKICTAAASSCELVLDDPAPAIAFTEMGASSLNFKLHCWAKSADWVAMQHQVRLAAYKALDANGIEIPFNQIVVHQAEA